MVLGMRVMEKKQKSASLLLIPGIIGGLVAGFAGAFFYGQTEIAELNSNIAGKDVQVSKLQSDISFSNDQLTETRNNLTSAMVTVTNLESEVMQKTTDARSLSVLLSAAQSEIATKNKKEELYTQAIDLARSSQIKQISLTDMLDRTGHEMTNENPAGAVKLLDDLIGAIPSATESQQELVDVYDELVEIETNQEREKILSDSKKLAQAGLELVKETKNVAEGVRSFLAVVQEMEAMQEGSDPTQEQILRWSVQLDESQNSFNAASQNISEAMKIEPSLDLTSEKESLETLRTVIQLMKEFISDSGNQ